jgi:hypothetical protein
VHAAATHVAGTEHDVNVPHAAVELVVVLAVVGGVAGQHKRHRRRHGVGRHYKGGRAQGVAHRCVRKYRGSVAVIT